MARRCLLAAVLVALGASAAAAQTRPNIVVILTDDLGYGDVSSYGATALKTPNIDRIAREGLRFTDAHSSDATSVSYGNPIGNLPTGKDHPELLTMHPSHGHDQTIVNGISRIGYMSGGRTALWTDENMADVFTNHAVAFIEAHKAAPFFLY